MGRQTCITLLTLVAFDPFGWAASVACLGAGMAALEGVGRRDNLHFAAIITITLYKIALN